MISFFNTLWSDVPTVWIDVETTGTRPSPDKAVQVGIVRFEGGVPVGEYSALVNPHRAIPAEATAIHGFTDADVADAPSIEHVFLLQPVIALLKDAQPGGYNGSFDKHFVPVVGDDLSWPWLDSLSLVRKVDRFVSGKGRHRLEAACKRHGIELGKAHDAGADAKAAGELFYKLGRAEFPTGYTMGSVLSWQRRVEAEEWARFNAWLSQQPPREE
jgi:DNA polymerase-3 subunit epsilon